MPCRSLVLMLLLVVSSSELFPAYRITSADRETQPSTSSSLSKTDEAVWLDEEDGHSRRGAVASNAYHRMRHRARQRLRHRNHRHHLDQDDTVVVELKEYGSGRRKSGGRSRMRRRNEALCASSRTTVHLGNDDEEFEPPFVVEIRCRNVAEYENGGVPLRSQKCVQGLLRCVQIYRDAHFSRRSKHSTGWQPYTRHNVPSACECMWPVERYGHQEL